ncbi:hypothetical protein R1flu_001567 [Riccia fluitans]|uniref:Uncharacterized protein n=1 Tax=Riccia fluitans TaxID=41844 RepID=A0ABD1Y6Y1_9MARC
MVGFKTSVSSSLRSRKRCFDFRASLLSPGYNYMFSSTPLVSGVTSPVFHSSARTSSRLPVAFVPFSSSAGPSESSTPKIPPTSPNEFPPPPPINPPETVNPDPATLREQWRYATRMYSIWYGHAWGTAILAVFALKRQKSTRSSCHGRYCKYMTVVSFGQRRRVWVVCDFSLPLEILHLAWT